LIDFVFGPQQCRSQSLLKLFMAPQKRRGHLGLGFLYDDGDAPPMVTDLFTFAFEISD
jgi:hypothetical protein